MSRERVEKTIVAVATPPGEGGLAVVRLSGPDAFAIADKVFSGPGFGPQPTPRRAVYGILKSPTESGTAISEIDQAIALPFVAPHSATGEDVVEFFCHGGRVVAGRIRRLSPRRLPPNRRRPGSSRAARSSTGSSASTRPRRWPT